MSLLTFNSAQLTPQKIGARYHTYNNDALRYAKFVSKIEGFERWGKTRNLAVRTTIMDSLEALKNQELQQNGFPL